MSIEVKGYLEQPADGLFTQDSQCEVRGWIVAERTPREAWLLVNGIPTLPLPLKVGRPDVAKVLGRNPDQVHVFQSTFAATPQSDRIHHLQLRVTDEEGNTHVVATTRIVLLNPGNVGRARFTWERCKLALGSLRPKAGRASPRALLRNLQGDHRTLLRLGAVAPQRMPSHCPKPTVVRLRSADETELAGLRSQADSLSPLPTFSLIMPFRPGRKESPDSAVLRLKALPYPELEVIPLDSADPKRFAAAVSAQLDRSQQWVGFIGSGDRLHPGALLRMATAIQEHPLADVFYSDEDRLIHDDTTSHRYRKPGWSQTLLLCQPYILRFAIYRRTLLEQIGGLRPGTGPAWEYDLALRATEQAREVIHVPEILHHHKQIPDDPAARCRVVEEAMVRQGLSGTAEPARSFLGQTLRLRPVTSPAVTIIVPTRDRARLLRPCIESVLRLTDYPSFEILIIDNGSVEQDTLLLFEQWTRDRRVSILRDEQPFHFAALNNAGVARATTPLVLLLNNDTEVIDANWLAEMVALIEAEDVGAVGARLRYGDGSIQHAGVVLGFGGVAGHAHKRFAFYDPGYHGLVHSIREVSAVTGACLLTRRKLWQELSGMDDRLAVAFNDVDYCLRLREKGYRILYTPNATLWHHESVSRGHDHRGQQRYEAERLLIQQRHGEALRSDPYFHKDLLLTASNYVESVEPDHTL